MPQKGLYTGSANADKWGSYSALIVQNNRDLEMSWQRCVNAGMDPGDRPEPTRITRDRLRGFYHEQSARVRGLALAEIRALYKQLGQRGFSLTFANADSVILDRISGKDIVAGRQGGDDLAPGNCWYETARGTNALGTAASTQNTTVVLGGDHYLRAYRDMICIAKPVFMASGGLAAILDATVQGRNGQMEIGELTYVLGLMHLSADHIETELFKEQHHQSIVIQTNAVSQTVAGGNAAFAFDGTGYLENASRGAVSAFADLELEIGCHFETVFRYDFSALRKRVDAPVDFLTLEDRKGRKYHATVYSPYRNRDSAMASRTALGAQPAVDSGNAADKSAEAAGFTSSDRAVLDAIATVERAAELGAHILIRGETGTGKELLARHIHRASGRSGQFVGVNCAAMPESLIEAELFGYQQGAFTGSRRGGSAGLVRQADGGTLFLDEIGDMPYDLQARLLRLLDSWRVRPVGSQQEYPVDVRLVTATNCDLEAVVADGAFRLDLLHRIKVVEVCLPALRERSDFDEIARALLAEIEPTARLDKDGLAELRTLSWPGNMRELRNVLMRLLIRADDGAITRAVVKKTLASGGEGAATNAAKHPIDDRGLESVLRRCGGNVAATARQLGVSRTTVYKHLRRLKKAGNN